MTISFVGTVMGVVVSTVCFCDADISCYLQFNFRNVNDELIKDVTFSSYQIESDKNNFTFWTFETNITWIKPEPKQLGRNIDRYLLLMQRVPLDNNLGSVDGKCGIQITENDIITNNTWYIFENLAYRERYSFRVYFIEEGSNVRGQPSVQKVFTTEDCYKLNGDAEFCSGQDVRYCGDVIDLRVDNITMNADRETVSVYISWIPPVHVRNNAKLSKYSYYYAGETEDVVSSIVEAKEMSHWSDRQSLNISGLHLDDAYKFSIQPFVDIDGSQKPAIPSDLQFNAFPNIGHWSEWIYISMCDLVCEGYQNRTRECYPAYANCTGEAFDSIKCYNASECFLAQGKVAPSSTMTYIATIIPVLLLALLFILIVFCQYKRAKKHNEDDILKETTFICALDPVFKDYEVASEEFVVWAEKKKIGSGRFGSVYSCPVYDLVQENQYFPAAIKTPLETSSAAERMAFKKEIELMIQIGKHRHIVDLLGCHTTSDPIYMIMELMPNGSLLDVLRKCEQSSNSGLYKYDSYNLCEDDLYCFGRQIACGMEYISGQKVVHGDLAARNVLVGVDNIVKISDFGLGQDTYEKSYVRLTDGEMPVKWYSIETITENLMTVKSDVWSFGILLYEIFTYGKSPYPGIVVQTLPSLLQSGYRMQRPEHCPYPAYELMKRCWHESAAKRPPFSELLKELDSIVESRTSIKTPYFKLDTFTSDSMKDEVDNLKYEDIELSSSHGDEDQNTRKDYVTFSNEAIHIDADLDPDEVARCLKNRNTELISNCDIEFVPRIEDSETGSTVVSEALEGSVISSVDSSFLAKCLVSNNTKFTDEGLNKVSLVPIFEDSGQTH